MKIFSQICVSLVLLFGAGAEAAQCRPPKAPGHCQTSQDCSPHQFCEMEFCSCFDCWPDCKRENNEYFCKTYCPDTWEVLLNAQSTSTPFSQDTTSEIERTDGETQAMMDELFWIILICVVIIIVIAAFVVCVYRGRKLYNILQKRRGIMSVWSSTSSMRQPMTDKGLPVVQQDSAFILNSMQAMSQQTLLGNLRLPDDENLNTHDDLRDHQAVADDQV